MIQIQREDSLQKISIGLWMILLSLILPCFFQAHHLGIMDNIRDSILNKDSGLLLLASAKLVFLNTIRAVPLYAGTFVMAEGFFLLFKSRSLGFIFPLVMIPTVYKLITLIYGIAYDFGSPAYLTIITIIIIHRSTVQIKPIIIKVLIISLFLFGLQWLDIIPWLSTYGFGRGELSVSIKRIANFLEGEYTMNFVGMCFALTIIINAFILSKVVIGYYHRLLLTEKSRAQLERLQKIEVEAVQSRYLQEIKNLVHDLKTPLVTIQGLSEIVMVTSPPGKVKEYTERINNSSIKMGQMISEILYDNSFREIKVQELFNFIRAQLSPEELGGRVQFEIQPNIIIVGNKIRLSRAIINLIENGLRAIHPDSGWVQVRVYHQSGITEILVSDNGVGIEEASLDKIWEVGYSTSGGRTGLGLNFVKQVIEEHGGTISIKSSVGRLTEARITLPEVVCEDVQNIGN